MFKQPNTDSIVVNDSLVIQYKQFLMIQYKIEGQQK